MLTMAKVTFVICVLVMRFQLYHQAESKSKLYNSSDLSYLSNGIQFPAPVALVSDPIANRTNQNVTVMEYVSRLFDHHSWDQRIGNVQNEKCQLDVNAYLQNLQNDTSWATKMFDASGHYGGQFFFGNDYWLGSSTLCWDLQNNQYNYIVPPFATNFFVAKVRLNYNDVLTPVTRQINVGQCLPRSCNATDVRMLMVQETIKGEMLSIIEVRPVPGEYKLFGDPKFLIVGGIFVAVSVIVVIASIVEHFMDKSSSKNVKDGSQIESNNNNNSDGDDKKENTKKTERPNGKPLRLLLCFSAMTNGRKLLSFDSQTNDPIQCIHGLRCFSIFWIVMVHTYLQVFAIAGNKSLRSVTERSFLYQTVSNATFSVDTFFFISGLLITVTYLRISKSKPKPQKEETTSQAVKASSLKFLTYLLYRYIRLTPVYMFTIGMNEIVIRFTHDRSVFTPAIYDHYSCASYWWRNALYINNFFPQTEFCMLWTWYMANDTQFYVVGIALLLLATRGSKHQKFAIGSLGVFLALSWIITFAISMQYNLYARVEEPFTLFDQLYDKPWLRFGPYAIGMAAGFILVHVKDLRLNPITVTLGWLLSAACALSLVYGLGSEGLKVPLSAFYSAFGHTAWGLCIAWLTIACYYGYGGPVNAVLSFRGLLPLSRMTFCAYLVHPIVMVITSFQLDGPYHLHNAMVIITFFGNVVASFLVATVLSLMFEAPAIRLLKVIIGGKKTTS